ncbi:hypothetical protein BRC2024_OFSGVTRC_CDS_0067 [Acinetobacter phage vB_AbaM_Rocket]
MKVRIVGTQIFGEVVEQGFVNGNFLYSVKTGEGKVFRVQQVEYV